MDPYNEMEKDKQTRPRERQDGPIQRDRKVYTNRGRGRGRMEASIYLPVRQRKTEPTQDKNVVLYPGFDTNTFLDSLLIYYDAIFWLLNVL
jgi:hypothetical protein